MPLYIQDWLSNNKLKLCSPGAHGLMINIMCLLHKEETYGRILLNQKYKQSDSTIKNFALMLDKLLPFSFDECWHFLKELIEEKTLLISGDFLVCERMVRDADLSAKRSLSGKEGGKWNKKNKQLKLKSKTLSKSEANTENEYENENEYKDEEIKEKKKAKKSNADHLFSDSEFIDFVKFEAQFEGTDYEHCNLKVYHEKVKNWSAAGGNKKKDWIATARNFMLSDKDKNKLILRNGTKQAGQGNQGEEEFRADIAELVKNKYG